jgi:hypothetical protein
VSIEQAPQAAVRIWGEGRRSLFMATVFLFSELTVLQIAPSQQHVLGICIKRIGK